MGRKSVQPGSEVNRVFSDVVRGVCAAKPIIEAKKEIKSDKVDVFFSSSKHGATENNVWRH
jgi:hypothetical protein